MLVEGFEGKKVQDVKKVIQAEMIDKVCIFLSQFDCLYTETNLGAVFM